MPEQFAADWLALREPADHAARENGLVSTLNAYLAAGEPARIIDLGAGSGSNLRYLAPRLAGPQHWVLIDHDTGLLRSAMDNAPGLEPPLRIETRRHDLRDWPLPITDANLITASALLDLVSASWIDQLAAHCAAHRQPALLALSIDGRIALTPEHEADAAVIAAVTAHQRSDKDMGRALGPDAITTAIERFRAHGLMTQTERSDWVLNATDSALQHALIKGWYAAACTQAPAEKALFAEWLAAREASLGNLTIHVGHQDLLVLP